MEPADVVADRAWAAIMFLCERPEKEMAVVAHGGFIGSEVFGHSRVDWEGSTHQGEGGHVEMRNCEAFTVEITHAKGDDRVQFRAL